MNAAIATLSGGAVMLALRFGDVALRWFARKLGVEEKNVP